MPITLELREDKRVLYAVVADPLSAEDLNNSIVEQTPIYDNAQGKLHQFVNVSGVTRLPSGILGIRRDSPIFQHRNSGQLIIVGAHGFVRSVGEVLMKIAHFESVKFFGDETEAWDYLRTVIANEKAAER